MQSHEKRPCKTKKVNVRALGSMEKTAVLDEPFQTEAQHCGLFCGVFLMRFV